MMVPSSNARLKRAADEGKRTAEMKVAGDKAERHACMHASQKELESGGEGLRETNNPSVRLTLGHPTNRRRQTDRQNDRHADIQTPWTDRRNRQRKEEKKGNKC